MVHFFQKNSARAPISSSTLGWDCLLTSQYEEKPCQAGDSSRAGRKAEPKPAEVETAGLREFVSSCIIVRFFFSVPHKTNIDSEKPSRERHRRRGAQANREIGLCSTAGSGHVAAPYRPRLLEHIFRSAKGLRCRVCHLIHERGQPGGFVPGRCARRTSGTDWRWKQP